MVKTSHSVGLLSRTRPPPLQSEPTHSQRDRSSPLSLDGSGRWQGHAAEKGERILVWLTSENMICHWPSGKQTQNVPSPSHPHSFVQAASSHTCVMGDVNDPVLVLMAISIIADNWMNTCQAIKTIIINPFRTQNSSGGSTHFIR